jgi:2C-methyl-D-erythritol 2,4-cyclodiphosphate synthase
MTGHLSKLMQIDQARINIKAKTNEGLGYLGQAEAIEAQVVVLLGA